MSDDSAYDYSNLTFVCSSAGMLYALDSAGDTAGTSQMAGVYLAFIS